jgi:hypothetical protein
MDELDAFRYFTSMLLYRLVCAAGRGDADARVELLGDEVVGLFEELDINPTAAHEALVAQWLGERAGLVREVN